MGIEPTRALLPIGQLQTSASNNCLRNSGHRIRHSNATIGNNFLQSNNSSNQ
jgi:hypothetical protein